MELFLPLLFLCYSKCVFASPSEFISLKFPKILEEGNLCSVTPTENGTCVLSPKCKLSGHQKTINICGWEGLTPKVCCSHNRQIEVLPSGDILQEGSACSINQKQTGTCEDIFNCPNAPKSGNVKICAWNGYFEYGFIICCPKEIDVSPVEELLQEGSACNLNINEKGTCKNLGNCTSLEEPTDILYFCSVSSFLVCCPTETGVTGSVFDKSKIQKTTSERSLIYQQRFKGPGCLTKSGPGAVCRDFFHCKNYPQGKQLYVCGWRRFTPQICCYEFENTDTVIRSPPTMESYQKEGSACDVTPNERGTCELVINCKTFPTEGVVNVCGWTRTMPIICCPELVLDKALNFSSGYFSVENIPPDCGFARETGVIEFYVLNGRKAEYLDFYVLNRTADILLTNGYSLEVTRMDFDSIDEMKAQKEGKNFVYTKNFYAAVAPTGGKEAAVERSQYMASLGRQISEKIEWLCDGVVINYDWVMSAAHCFVGSDVKPNVIRLGVYRQDESIFEDNHDYYIIEDFGIADVVFYPDFVDPQRYHDIVLIRLSRPVPKKNPYINRICLPWGSQSDQIIEGRDLTLTGWGATKYLGDKTKVLQEVNLTVFNTVVCDASYSSLRDYMTKWPEGMDPDRILCAGSIEGGKDACKGDSGGPLVFIDKLGRYTLAGIVSAGYGCGLKEFPGIYIPITSPEYLDWIKKVAF